VGRRLAHRDGRTGEFTGEFKRAPDLPAALSGEPQLQA
jgi:hypothetical protein